MIKSYQLKNKEKRYMFQIYVGVDPLTGKEIRTTRRGFKTKKEASLALARLRIEIDNGDYSSNKKPETYHEMYDLWVKHYENTVEESTFVKTTRLFKNHILPALSLYKIDKMNVDICQSHVNDWAKKLKNVRIVKSYASKVMDFAIKRDYIKTNPFSFVDIPRKMMKKKEFEKKFENFYSREELLRFLSCLKKEENYKAYTFFRLLAFSGMRKGEALALEWNDINFKQKEISINKALSRGKDSKLYVKSTKTGISRDIKMDQQTLDILKTWKKRQKQDYLPLGINTTRPKQLVFSNIHNKYIQPSKTRKWILNVQKKYNLPQITTHGLRHTHCSLLFEAGANLKEVQDRLGHTDVQTTMNIYAHVTKTAKENAIQKFENFLSVN